jgi:hypothetical protein
MTAAGDERFDRRQEYLPGIGRMTFPLRRLCYSQYEL